MQIYYSISKRDNWIRANMFTISDVYKICSWYYGWEGTDLSPRTEKIGPGFP